MVKRPFSHKILKIETNNLRRRLKPSGYQMEALAGLKSEAQRVFQLVDGAFPPYRRWRGGLWGGKRPNYSLLNKT